VPGDLGLALTQRASQLTDAEFSLTGDQQHHANPIVVGQAFENGGRCQMVSHCSSQGFDFTGTNI
jgi:hypothetical protein